MNNTQFAALEKWSYANERASESPFLDLGDSIHQSTYSSTVPYLLPESVRSLSPGLVLTSILPGGLCHVGPPSPCEPPGPLPGPWAVDARLQVPSTMLVTLSRVHRGSTFEGAYTVYRFTTPDFASSTVRRWYNGRITAFQAVDPGSIPGRRNFLPCI